VGVRAWEEKISSRSLSSVAGSGSFRSVIRLINYVARLPWGRRACLRRRRFQRRGRGVCCSWTEIREGPFCEEIPVSFWQKVFLHVHSEDRSGHPNHLAHPPSQGPAQPAYVNGVAFHGRLAGRRPYAGQMSQEQRAPRHQPPHRSTYPYPQQDAAPVDTTSQSVPTPCAPQVQPVKSVSAPSDPKPIPTRGYPIVERSASLLHRMGRLDGG
jgi:hypothetical protein